MYSTCMSPTRGVCVCMCEDSVVPGTSVVVYDMWLRSVVYSGLVDCFSFSSGSVGVAANSTCNLSNSCSEL